MPTDATARAQQLQPGAPDEADYHAFCAALSESARGRAFLAEYARRNRNADTRPLLTAIERLQISLATDPAAPAVPHPPPIALVRTDMIMAEVTFAEPQPAPVNELEVAPPAAVPIPPAPLRAPMPTDPLAAMKMLSEEERLALFT